ncbi:MAG: hypothetical protein ACLPJH_12400 [Myxococcaceae bacterium]
MPTTKRCPRCTKTKTVDQFSTDRLTRLGCSTYCKSCLTLYRRAWKAANPENVRESQRKWREKNRAQHLNGSVESPK